jgi:hypothetical protein
VPCNCFYCHASTSFDPILGLTDVTGIWWYRGTHCSILCLQCLFEVKFVLFLCPLSLPLDLFPKTWSLYAIVCTKLHYQQTCHYHIACLQFCLNMLPFLFVKFCNTWYFLTRLKAQLYGFLRLDVIFLLFRPIPSMVSPLRGSR